MSSQMKAVAKAPLLSFTKRTTRLKVLPPLSKDADTELGGNADPVQLFFQSRVHEFIKQYKNNTPANLLALSNGKWRVPADKMDELLDLYIAEYKQVPFSLVLLKSPVYPYPMDLDHLEDAASLGSPLEVMKVIIDTLSEVLGEKSEIVQHAFYEQRMERRFHVIFQNIIVDEAAAIKLYRAHIAALIKKAPEVKWESIVDKSVVTSNGIRLLGSYKYPDVRDSEGKIAKGVTRDGKLYSIRRLDREGGYYQPCTINFESKTIETLSITKHAILDRSLFRPDLTPADVIDTSMLDVTRDLETCSITDKASPINQTVDNSESHSNADSEHDIVVKLMGLLNHSRFSDYLDWRDIATSLKNDYGERYKELWLKYSRTSPKFDLESALALWEQVAKANYTGRRLTVRSIHQKAKLDSPHSYAELVDTIIDPKIEECIAQGGAGHRLAEIFVMLHGEVFVCTNPTSRTIYHFKDHRWIESGIGTINLLLSDTIYKAFVNKGAKIGSSLAHTDTDTENNENAAQKQRYEICIKIALKLLDPRYKSSLLTEICHMIEDRKFFEKLDTKAHLIGFENGVFDLEEEGFRAGDPQDLISFSCGYDYAFDDLQDVQTEIASFVMSCFDDEETGLYTLLTYAACIYGYRKFEEFYIQTGTGANGKGAINELIMQTFGDYAKTMEASYFTETSTSSSKATPQLADKKGVRVLISSEPEHAEKLQVGRLKKITGNDEIQARQLHQALFYYRPMFGIFIQCNKIPKVSKIDGGVIRRLRVVEFPFQFVEKPLLPHERQGDPEVKRVKVHSLVWKQQFMRALIYLYVRQVKHMDYLGMPQRVADGSKAYLEKCNPIAVWLNEHYEVTGKEAHRVPAREAYTSFKMDTSRFDLSENDFSEGMELCKVFKKRFKKSVCYIGILRNDLDIDTDTEPFVAGN